MHNSRGAGKKRSQKVHVVRRTNEATAALNTLYGCVLPDASAVPIAFQLAAQELIFKSVTMCVAPEAVQQQSPEEAYSALLGLSALYGDGGPWKSYAKGAVSLPDDVADSSFVTSVLGWRPGNMARIYKPSDVIKRRV